MQIIIFVLALICFLGSAGYLGKYFLERHASKQNMDDVKSLLVQETGISETETDENDILIKYSQLHKENPDFAGWIQIPDTTIDYPVMYVKDDNETYLYANFKKNMMQAAPLHRWLLLSGSCQRLSDHLRSSYERPQHVPAADEL